VSGYDTSRLHGDWHEDYERGRPGWPAAAIEWIGLPSRADVLELGAGTGKLTGLLAPRYAVEPDEGMRRVLRRVCPDANVLDGTAESIPLDDDSVDAVFAAEAFHRFEGEASVAEIARVLRPSGVLVLLWNVPGGEDHADVAAAVDLLTARAPADVGHEPADLNTHRYSSGAWRAAFARSPFERFEEAEFDNPQQIDRDALLAFFSSMGWLSERADRAAILAELDALLTQPSYRRLWRARAYATRLA
jgi:SAM-dependent methyltransferase